MVHINRNRLSEEVEMTYLSSMQLDIMLFLGGACGILAVMTLLARSLPTRTKHVLAAMETSAMFLLLFDRFAYKFEGDTSRHAYFMIRLSNGMLYFFLLFMTFLLTHYVVDLLIDEGKLPKRPLLLRICDFVFLVGLVCLLIAPFNHMYYYIDAENVYHRGTFHLLCYVFPFIIISLNEITIIRYRKRLSKRFATSLFISISLPIIATIAQIFLFNYFPISLTTITMALVMIVFYTYALNFISLQAQRAKEHELMSYKEAQKKESEMFEETTEALANAIDAKDKYTSGHSIRVALYSRQIARAAHLPDETCNQVYFAALLHDVGKIGIPLEIINKVGKLNNEEYNEIKKHPFLGYQILSSIQQAPYLAEGARYHHERYDGHGYPDGIKGADIPVIVRIIAVADAYDAMTSVRSYREPLTRDEVKEELRHGIGTQFDPTFARIMLRVMDDEERHSAPV